MRIIYRIVESDKIMFTQHVDGLDLKVGFGFWKDLGAARAAGVEVRLVAGGGGALGGLSDSSLL